MTAAVIVQDRSDNNKILLVKRGNEPFKGEWALPAGFVEYGELPIDAASRELGEEVGISATMLRMVGQYLETSHPKTFSALTVFHATEFSGTASPSDDASEVAYYKWDSLPEMAFSGQVRAINDFFKE